MKINIFGSTGTIGIKTLNIIKNYYPKYKVNLLCANSNYQLLYKQVKIYRPKYVYLNTISSSNLLRSKLPVDTKILTYKNLKIHDISLFDQRLKRLNKKNVQVDNQLSYFHTVLLVHF